LGRKGIRGRFRERKKSRSIKTLPTPRDQDTTEKAPIFHRGTRPDNDAKKFFGSSSKEQHRQKQKKKDRIGRGFFCAGKKAIQTQTCGAADPRGQRGRKSAPFRPKEKPTEWRDQNPPRKAKSRSFISREKKRKGLVEPSLRKEKKKLPRCSKKKRVRRGGDEGKGGELKVHINSLGQSPSKIEK